MNNYEHQIVAVFSLCLCVPHKMLLEPSLPVIVLLI